MLVPESQTLISGSIEELVNALDGFKKDRHSFIIAIDGRDGVGKSRLAKILKQHLDASVISVDDFVTPALGCYLNALRIDRLKEEMANASTGVVILEGIRILDVLDSLGLASSCHIYIKHMKYGLWVDEKALGFEGDVAELICRENCELSQYAGKECSIDLFQEEILAYHVRRRPHVCCDIIVESEY